MIVHEHACSGEGELAEKMKDCFGPGHIDQLIRQAVQWCWTALPKERRNARELEKQVRRLVDRALKDFREDNEAFAQPKKGRRP